MLTSIKSARAFIVGGFLISISLATLATNGPPVFCIKKNDSGSGQSECIAYLFGSIHLSHKPAVTEKLLEIARKSDYILIESLPIQGVPPLRMSEINQTPAEYRAYVNDHAQRNFLKIPDIMVWLSDEYKKDDEHTAYRKLSSIWNSWCGYNYTNGTEMSVVIELVGSKAVVDVVEKQLPPGYKSTGKRSLRSSSKAYQEQRIVGKPTPEQARGFMCQFTRDFVAFWESQIKCHDDINACFELDDPEQAKLEVIRINNMLANIIQAIDRNTKPLVIVGMGHLYGNDGLIAGLSRRSYTVSVVK